MTTPSPPRPALALLNRFGPQDEVLAGDLVEEFEAGRSRLWFWKQVVAAIVATSVQSEREIRPLRLVEDDSPSGSVGRHLAPPQPMRRAVNLTASPIGGIGGLGLVTLGALVTMVIPEIWWVVVVAMCGGVGLGIARVLASRRRHRL